MAADRYLTPAEVAARLGVKRATLWKWVAAGKLRAVRLGGPRGRIRILEADLAPFLGQTPVSHRPDQGWRLRLIGKS